MKRVKWETDKPWHYNLVVHHPNVAIGLAAFLFAATGVIVGLLFRWVLPHLLKEAVLYVGWGSMATLFVTSMFWMLTLLLEGVTELVRRGGKLRQRLTAVLSSNTWIAITVTAWWTGIIGFTTGNRFDLMATQLFGGPFIALGGMVCALVLALPIMVGASKGVAARDAFR